MVEKQSNPLKMIVFFNNRLTQFDRCLRDFFTSFVFNNRFCCLAIVFRIYFILPQLSAHGVFTFLYKSFDVFQYSKQYYSWYKYMGDNTAHIQMYRLNIKKHTKQIKMVNVSRLLGCITCCSYNTTWIWNIFSPIFFLLVHNFYFL